MLLNHVDSKACFTACDKTTVAAKVIFRGAAYCEIFSNRPRSNFCIDKKQDRPQLYRFDTLYSPIEIGMLHIVVEFVLETQELPPN